MLGFSTICELARCIPWCAFLVALRSYLVVDANFVRPWICPVGLLACWIWVCGITSFLCG
jgi:hypothetical protein